MPAASIASVTASLTSGTKSAKAGEPNAVGTPAVRLRSLIAVGTPCSGPASGSTTSEPARSSASSGVSVTNAPTSSRRWARSR